jgi:hypothetical protein
VSDAELRREQSLSDRDAAIEAGIVADAMSRLGKLSDEETLYQRNLGRLKETPGQAEEIAA